MKIGLRQWAIDNVIELVNGKSGKISLNLSVDLTNYLESVAIDSVAPALCDEGCEVEPDGHYSHGGPSILLACGLI